MAKGIHDYTAQESVAPYIKAVVSTASDMDACRAVYIKTGASHTLTIDGEDVAFTGLLPGTVYKFSCTKSNNANVIFLY